MLRVKLILEIKKGIKLYVYLNYPSAQLSGTRSTHVHPYKDTTPTQPHRISNAHRTKNNTTNVVIQQNSRKLLMMDILMSETC